MTRWWKDEIDARFGDIGPNRDVILSIIRREYGEAPPVEYAGNRTDEAFPEHDLPADLEKHELIAGGPLSPFEERFDVYQKPDGRTADGFSSTRKLLVPHVPFDASYEVGHLEDMEFRNPVEPEIIWEIAPLLSERHPEWFVTDAEWTGTLPMGYQEQERHIPIIVIPYGARSKEIRSDMDVTEAMEALESGEDLVAEPDTGSVDSLDPEMGWEGVVGPYYVDIEYERVDESTGEFRLSGATGSTSYRECRKELSFHADEYGLDIETVETGDPVVLRLHS